MHFAEIKDGIMFNALLAAVLLQHRGISDCKHALRRVLICHVILMYTIVGDSYSGFGILLKIIWLCLSDLNDKPINSIVMYAQF